MRIVVSRRTAYWENRNICKQQNRVKYFFLFKLFKFNQKNTDKKKKLNSATHSHNTQQQRMRQQQKIKYREKMSEKEEDGTTTNLSGRQSEICSVNNIKRHQQK